MNQKQTRLTLLKKIQQVDNEIYWDDFVRYYEGYIYVIIRDFGLSKEDCEDLLQVVLVKVWKGLPKYTYQEGKCRCRTWLCKVVKNAVYNFLDLKVNRNQKKNVSYDQVLSSLNLYTAAEIDVLAEREWKTYISNLAWENLKGEFSDISRRVFEASLIESDNSVLAEKFEVAESSVRVYKIRIRKALLKEIVRLNQELDG